MTGCPRGIRPDSVARPDATARGRSVVHPRSQRRGKTTLLHTLVVCRRAGRILAMGAFRSPHDCTRSPDHASCRIHQFVQRAGAVLVLMGRLAPAPLAREETRRRDSPGGACARRSDDLADATNHHRFRRRAPAHRDPGLSRRTPAAPREPIAHLYLSASPIGWCCSTGDAAAKDKALVFSIHDSTSPVARTPPPSSSGDAGALPVRSPTDSGGALARHSANPCINRRRARTVFARMNLPIIRQPPLTYYQQLFSLPLRHPPYSSCLFDFRDATVRIDDDGAPSSAEAGAPGHIPTACLRALFAAGAGDASSHYRLQRLPPAALGIPRIRRQFIIDLEPS